MKIKFLNKLCAKLPKFGFGNADNRKDHHTLFVGWSRFPGLMHELGVWFPKVHFLARLTLAYTPRRNHEYRGLALEASEKGKIIYLICGFPAIGHLWLSSCFWGEKKAQSAAKKRLD